MSAVAGDHRIDVLVEKGLHSLGQGVQPEWVGIAHHQRATEAVGVEGDAVEIGDSCRRGVERDPVGTVEDHVAIAGLSGEDQGEVVDELTVRPPGDRDPDPGVGLLAVGADLLDAGQRVVGGVDAGGAAYGCVASSRPPETLDS